MNLEEFVASVLVNLDKAVNRARKETSRDISFTNTSDARTVEFDIAVSAEQEDGKTGKAGVKVLHFAEGGGEMSRVNKNSTVSRIRFGVHISAMTKEEAEEDRRLVDSHNSDVGNFFG